MSGKIDSKRKAQVCMIIPYFGKWPEWIDLYLFSCSKVKNIDFYFFTDCILPAKIYKNTKFIRTSFTNYCQKISNKLKIHFCTHRAYKLCDVRPFYGLIHDDIVNQYEFWGFSDLDLVYGNMDTLINERNLEKYDVITSHSTRIAGHFTIIRTKSKYNFICKNIPDWKTKLEDGEKNYGMDERYLTQELKPSMRIMHAIWNHILSKRVRVRSKEYYKCYQVMQDLLHFTSPKILFQEGYTTLVPLPNEHWFYYCSTGTIEKNKEQRTKNKEQRTKNKEQSIPYLHFLFFKKTPYLDTNWYWTEGFYKIPSAYSFHDGDIVDISLKGISLKKEKYLEE